jgi:hypothetical protein
MSMTIDQVPPDMTWARFLSDVAPKNVPYLKGFVMRLLSPPDQYNRCYIHELELRQCYFTDGVYRYIGYDELTDTWYWK